MISKESASRVVIPSWSGAQWLRAAGEQLARRYDRAQYALACDHEACEHYNLKPSAWHRAVLAVKAFLLNQ